MSRSGQLEPCNSISINISINRYFTSNSRVLVMVPMLNICINVIVALFQSTGGVMKPGFGTNTGDHYPF